MLNYFWDSNLKIKMAQKNNDKLKLSQSKFPVEIGKIPPQAVDLEEAVLGAMMLEKDSITSVIDILKPESFYKEAHQKIYRAIVDLSIAEKPVDILTVTEELKRAKVLEETGGYYYVAQLTTNVASSAHVEFHARIIAQKYIQRELIRITSGIQHLAFDDSVDVDDLLDSSENELFKLAEGNIKKESIKVGSMIGEALRLIEEASKRENNLSGIASGYTELDRMTSGWQKSDLVIIAARPAMGKTAFVLSMTRNMAIEYQTPVALFSLEMSSMQLVNRLICSISELSSEKIRSGKLSNDEWKMLETKTVPLHTAPIFIDDTPGISIFELRAKCRRLVKQHKIGIIIIDYLQLMTGPPELRANREQEVSVISRSLKGLSKELNVPIIALSQLNRSVEMRGGEKKPQLSDLRESGAIEQDADMVIFIHRPEKMGILEDSEGNSNKGVAELIVAKHRNGATGEVRLRFRENIARFVDWDGFESLDAIDIDNHEPVVTLGSKMNQENSIPSPINHLDYNLKPNTGFGNFDAF